MVTLQMKGVTQSLATLITTLVFAGPLALPEATKYRSCDALLAKYPKGVARDAKAASQARAKGLQKPKVNKSVYVVNGPRLDRDRDGVACEQS